VAKDWKPQGVSASPEGGQLQAGGGLPSEKDDLHPRSSEPAPPDHPFTPVLFGPDRRSYPASLPGAKPPGRPPARGMVWIPGRQSFLHMGSEIHYPRKPAHRVSVKGSGIDARGHQRPGRVRVRPRAPQPWAERARDSRDIIRATRPAGPASIVFAPAGVLEPGPIPPLSGSIAPESWAPS